VAAGLEEKRRKDILAYYTFSQDQVLVICQRIREEEVVMVVEEGSRI